jgi:hypothetical protein
VTWRISGLAFATIGVSILLSACGQTSTAAGFTGSACRTFALRDARNTMGASIHSGPKMQASTCIYVGPGDERLIVGITPNTAGYRRGLKLGSAIEHAGPVHSITVPGASAGWQAVTTSLGPGTLAVGRGYGHIATVQVTGTSRTTLQAVAGIRLVLRNISTGASP